MSDAHKAIHGALDLRLSRLPGLPQTRQGIPAVAWENRRFPPPGDGLPQDGFWLRPTFLPSRTRQATLGVDGFNEFKGIYQVSIFGPAGLGRGTAETLAEAVLNHFRRGTVMEHEGVTVRVKRAGRQNARQEPDAYHLPVEIEWMAHALNQ